MRLIGVLLMVSFVCRYTSVADSQEESSPEKNIYYRYETLAEGRAEEQEYRIINRIAKIDLPISANQTSLEISVADGKGKTFFTGYQNQAQDEEGQMSADLKLGLENGRGFDLAREVYCNKAFDLENGLGYLLTFNWYPSAPGWTNFAFLAVYPHEKVSATRIYKIYGDLIRPIAGNEFPVVLYTHHFEIVMPVIAEFKPDKVELKINYSKLDSRGRFYVFKPRGDRQYSAKKGSYLRFYRDIFQNPSENISLKIEGEPHLKIIAACIPRETLSASDIQDSFNAVERNSYQWWIQVEVRGTRGWVIGTEDYRNLGIMDYGSSGKSLLTFASTKKPASSKKQAASPNTCPLFQGKIM